MALPSVQQLQTPLLAVPYNNDEVTLHHELLTRASQPSPHFSYSEINALPLNGQQAVTAISALWLRRSTAFRWLQQPIGRHLMIDVIEQVIERHPKVQNEGISESFNNNSEAGFIHTETVLLREAAANLDDVIIG